MIELGVELFSDDSAQDNQQEPTKKTRKIVRFSNEDTDCLKALYSEHGRSTNVIMSHVNITRMYDKYTKAQILRKLKYIRLQEQKGAQRKSYPRNSWVIGEEEKKQAKTMKKMARESTKDTLLLIPLLPL